MANTRTLQRSFNGGELTAEMFGQIQDAKYGSGMAACRNFIVLPHGPATNRPGTAYVSTVKNSSTKTRLIPFVYSTTQTMVLELGAGYIRFHTQGATLLNAAGTAPYEIANSYAEADLFDIHYVQSADVLTLTHPNYPPAELKRLGATNWTLTNISFASTLTAPGSVTATATGGTGTTYKYVVTSVGANGIDESVASGIASCNGNLLATGAYNTITWAASSGAQRYKVYKFSGGLYGYIGQTDATSFTDDNIIANMATTPPIVSNPFSGAGNYPGAVSYFEQRRCFAGTINQPQNIWMTKSGTESNLNYSLPTRDDDAINFRVAAREANTIRHIVPLTNMVLLTSSAEWRVTSLNSDAITPTTISVRPQSYIGASNVQPVIINNNLIYAAARGGHLRELAYSWQASGYITGDLSLRAPHLFDNRNIVDMAYAKAPQPIVWMVSDNGNLLGLTYVPEQQVGAWHRHDTDGVFESCCVVAEGNEDMLYVIVRRTVNGASVRYVERMASRQWATQADAFYVDCGATLDSATAITHVSGLTWLEGKTVSILTDGAVHRQLVVTGGSVTLDYPAKKVQIGLPITADMQTLPWTAQIDGAFGQGRTKNVNKVWLRVNNSGGVFAGPDASNLTEYKQRTTENYGVATSLISREIQITITPSWNDAGQVFIRQANPLPITLVSMTMEVSIGS
ncbi:hypothetical protein [Pseudomonas sp.]|uniref:hypothetical protein n=1 Tax=Pseudomonas sp. TaxID=306 RepID=UPI0025895786|nr:hypothetical protein [Pseudomonas sp.]